MDTFPGPLEDLDPQYDPGDSDNHGIGVDTPNGYGFHVEGGLYGGAMPQGLFTATGGENQAHMHHHPAARQQYRNPLRGEGTQVPEHAGFPSSSAAGGTHGAYQPGPAAAAAAAAAAMRASSPLTRVSDGVPAEHATGSTFRQTMPAAPPRAAVTPTTPHHARNAAQQQHRAPGASVTATAAAAAAAAAAGGGNRGRTGAGNSAAHRSGQYDPVAAAAEAAMGRPYMGDLHDEFLSSAATRRNAGRRRRQKGDSDEFSPGDESEHDSDHQLDDDAASPDKSSKGRRNGRKGSDGLSQDASKNSKRARGGRGSSSACQSGAADALEKKVEGGGTWDDIMVKSLIDIVGKKKGARDGKDTDIAWTKVADNHAEQLKHTAEQCRNKWNKLRELYHIVLKYDNQTGQNMPFYDQDAKRQKDWFKDRSGKSLGYLTKEQFDRMHYHLHDSATSRAERVVSAGLNGVAVKDSDDLSKRQKWGSGQSRSKASATAEVMRESTKANLAAAQAQVKQDRRRQRLEQKKMVAQQQQSKRLCAAIQNGCLFMANALVAGRDEEKFNRMNSKAEEDGRIVVLDDEPMDLTLSDHDSDDVQIVEDNSGRDRKAAGKTAIVVDEDEQNSPADQTGKKGDEEAASVPTATAAAATQDDVPPEATKGDLTHDQQDTNRQQQQQQQQQLAVRRPIC